MIRAYVYLVISFLFSFIGTLANYSLVIYNIYPQPLGFAVEMLFVIILICSILYALYRVKIVSVVKIKILHGAIVLLMTLCALYLIIDLHIPFAIEMYHGTLSCPTCP